MIVFCSDTDDNIDPEDESTFPEAYIDYAPQGLENLHSFCIPINLSDPDFDELKRMSMKYLIGLIIVSNRPSLCSITRRV